MFRHRFCYSSKPRTAAEQTKTRLQKIKNLQSETRYHHNPKKKKPYLRVKLGFLLI